MSSAGGWLPNFGGHKHQFSWHRSMEAALSWPSFQERQRPRPNFSWDIKCGHVPVEGLVVTLPLNQKQNEDNDKGFWAVFLLKLVPFPQPPSLIKKKKHPIQEVHFLDMNRPKAQTLPLWASPASVLSLCMYRLRVFRDTGGISSNSKGNRIVFCLFPCYVVLKCNFLFMRY